MTSSNHGIDRSSDPSTAAPNEVHAAPIDERAAGLVEYVEPERQPGGTWPASQSAPLSVLIPARNEQKNIVECLRRLTWAEHVVVVDSSSTDLTAPLAQAMGAEVFQFHYPPEGWPKKKNWALENVPWRHEWLLIMDADERMTPELAAEIVGVCTGRETPGGADCEGYWLNRRFIFLGKWIEHCGFYPSWNVRLFKHRTGRYERIGHLSDTGSGDNEVHEHVVLSNVEEPGYLKNDFLHYAYPDLDSLIEKHTRYAAWEAHAMGAKYKGGITPSLLGGSIARRRWLRVVTRTMPLRPMLRFIYCYIVLMGFLDGRPGYIMCRFLAWYEFISLAKYHEMKLKGRVGERLERDAGLTVLPESATAQADPETEGPPRTASAAYREFAAEQEDAVQMQPEPSPWSFREKAGRALWLLIGRPSFRASFHNWHRFRTILLRLFGAKVGKRVSLRPTVNVEVPWMLEIDDDASIGDHVIIYCLGHIKIGRRAIVSQYAHLCAGTHDYSDATFKLVRSPITIGSDVWIGADAFIGPGVTVGDLAVVGARSSVYKDLDFKKVYVGNPAKSIKDRILR